jgi:Spy/CpxP family protein refolding chaperone
MRMNKGQFAKPMTVAVGFFLLCVLPGLSRAQSGSPSPMQSARVASPAHAKNDAQPADDFAGLNYTDEQKAEIDKIHRESESRMNAVAKDQKLTADQKGAMLQGYARLGYGELFKVLTPEQQKVVRNRVNARREADKAAKKQQPPRN